MSKKSNGGWSFGLGIAAGLAIGYYLSSKEGRALQGVALEKIGELGETVGEKVQETFEEATGEFASAVKMGVDLMKDTTSSKQQEVVSDEQSLTAVAPNPARLKDDDFISRARSNFMKGMEKARLRIEQLENQEEPNA